MARKRYLSTDISVDARVGDLAQFGMFAPLLYTWCIPHADDWGRLTGDARQVKMLVCPSLDVTASEVDEALDQIATVGLWIRYTADDRKYIQFPPTAWFQHQSYINKDKRDKDNSAFPAPPQGDAMKLNAPDKSSQTESGTPKTTASGNTKRRKQAAENTQNAEERRKEGAEDPQNPASVTPSPSNVKSIAPAARSSLEKSFDLFWQEYRPWCGRDKQEAWMEWQKLKPDRELFRKVMAALKSQKAVAEEIRSAGGFVAEPKYACRWIKRKCWEDDVNERSSPEERPEPVHPPKYDEFMQRQKASQ